MTEQRKEGITVGAIYGRYSTHEQDTGSSKDSQITRAKQKAKSMDVIIPPELIFFDEARTGTKDNRPEFNRMIDAADEKPPAFQILYCEDTSRFARNVLHARLYKQRLNKRGVKIIYTSQDFGDDVEGRFVEGIMEAVDEFQSQIIRRKTINHMVDNVKAGFSNGGRPPLGLKRKVLLVDEDSGKTKVKWVPDPETAPVIRKIFEMRAEGRGPTEIVRVFSWFRKPNGRTLTIADLYYWFRHCTDTYAGCLTWGKSTDRGRTFQEQDKWIVQEGTIEPIISQSIAEKVKRIYKNKITPIRKQRTGSLGLYLGTSLLRCGVCGRRLNADSNRQRQEAYYVCHGHKVRHECDHTKYYKVSVVDRKIKQLLTRNILSEKSISRLIQKIEKKLDESHAGSKEKEKDTLRKLLKKCEDRLDRLKEAVASGSIPMSVLSDKIQEETARRAEVIDYINFLDNLGEIRGKSVPREKIREAVEGFEKVMDSGDQVKVKQLVNEIITKITVSKDGKFTIYYDQGRLIESIDYYEDLVVGHKSPDMSVSSSDLSAP